MPFGTQKAFQRLALPKPEILMYPLETTVIDSAVINATGVVADVSGPYVGRRYLVAGTILHKRVDSQYEQFTGTGTVAGILYDTVEFADGTDASDEPVAILRRNVSFDKLKIVAFATYATNLGTDLPTCEFV